MAPNRILLSVRQQLEREDPLSASKDVTPGMFLETAGAASRTVQPHSNASAIPEQVMVAVEAPWRSGSGIADAYDQDGEQVPYHIAISGDQLYVLLAAGENVDALTDRLGSNGDGTTKIATTYAFLRPLELVDNTYGAAAVRIKVEVL
jgi:hypothetical protein